MFLWHYNPITGLPPTTASSIRHGLVLTPSVYRVSVCLTVCQSKVVFVGCSNCSPNLHIRVINLGDHKSQISEL